MALARSHADGLKKKKGEYNLVAITEAVVASAIGVRGPFFYRKRRAKAFRLDIRLMHFCNIHAR